MGDPVSEYSVWKEAALVISLLTNCVNLVGFVSTAWAVPVDREHDKDFEGLGLWRFCSHNIADDASEACLKTVNMDLPSWFLATQAMMTMGFIIAFLALGTIIVSECSKKVRYNITVLYTAIMLSFLGTILNMIGIIIFGTCIKSGEPLNLPGEEGYTYDVAWSFTACAVAAGTSILAGVFLLFELINNKTLRYVKRLDDVATAGQGGNTGRLDNSFSPYTSFPDIDETPTQNGNAGESIS